MPLLHGPLLLALLLLAGPARADGPGLRSGPGQAGDWDEPAGRGAGPPVPSIPVRPRPPRRVMGGPDYVGSDYGLGKPAYHGLGSRPDWGRSGID